MSNATVYDELDQAVNAFISDQAPASSGSAEHHSNQVLDLLHAARELQYVARPRFKTQLRRDLMDQAFVSRMPGEVASVHEDGRNGKGTLYARRRTATARNATPFETPLPSLFAAEGTHAARRGNFVASVALHAAVVGAFVASSVWMAGEHATVDHRVVDLVPTASIYLSPEELRGGGAGGAHNKLMASEGQAPKFAHQQLTPPTVVVHRSQPALTAEPTVVGPPNLSLPQLSQLGDPLSRVVPASNGTGGAGGMGSNLDTGVGGGNGLGVGIGRDAGTGGGVFRIGGGVSAPRAIYAPDPEYSEEARKAHYQGTVVLWAVVGPDGLPKELRLQRKLGMGLDQKALEAVRHWRFQPAMKDGQPVAVQVNIELNFRLY